MTREEAIELLKQYKLAEIIAAVQEAYRRGHSAGKSVGLQLRADLDDDIQF